MFRPISARFTARGRHQGVLNGSTGSPDLLAHIFKTNAPRSTCLTVLEMAGPDRSSQHIKRAKKRYPLKKVARRNATRHGVMYLKTTVSTRGLKLIRLDIHILSLRGFALTKLIFQYTAYLFWMALRHLVPLFWLRFKDRSPHCW